MTEFVTHDVKRFILTRPENFEFKPGQGVKFVINEPAWKDEEGHPFTPTCLAGDRVLEFMIKKYPADKGVTERLHSLEPGAQILLSEAFGTITYKGEGTFIAAGAGITPFIVQAVRVATALGQVVGVDGRGRCVDLVAGAVHRGLVVDVHDLLLPSHPHVARRWMAVNGTST